MEQFVVSARKYRPRKFEEVVGQQGVTHTLKNAIVSDHLAHALLFCGPRGVGKTTCARILARMINSELPPDQYDPSNEDHDVDRFNVYELDAASNNSVEDIRTLVDQVRFPPQTGKYKVYIIDEVHMLSAAAFNAFLKTLEEPPPYAIFILATTEKHKILPTILSRCQIYDFNRITIDDIVGHLQHICEQEAISADADALHIIAEKADGALRDALSLFDRLVDYGSKSLTYQSVLENLNILDYDYFFRVTDMLMAQDMTGLMLLFDEVIRKGFDGDNFIGGLEEHFRNLMVAKTPQTIGILEVSDDLKQRYMGQGQLIPNGFLVNALNMANQCEIHYRTSKNKRLHVELALMKMCYLPAALQLSADDSKKNSIGEGSVAPTAAPVSAAAPATEPKVEAGPVPQKPQATEKAEPGSTQVAEPKPEVTKTPEPQPQADTEPTPNQAPEPKPQSAKPGINAEQKRKAISSLTGGISLKDAHKASEEEKEEEAVVIPTYIELDSDALQKAWEAYKEKLQIENRQSLYNLMSNTYPAIMGPKLTLALGSKIQQELFDNERVALLDFLKAELNVTYLELETMIDKSLMADAPKKAFTNKDKLVRMAEKNPNLRTMIEKLDLHLDD